MVSDMIYDIDKIRKELSREYDNLSVFERPKDRQQYIERRLYEILTKPKYRDERDREKDVSKNL